MTDDTIAAISTPIGQGGIGIVRVSGPRALEIADKIFRSRAGQPSSFATNTIHFGRLVDCDRTVDHVMLAVLRAPHSYTMEDTVEINFHGGVYIARRVLQLCVSHGARLAAPGEFTKRAFLNGRLDLAQAEAVMDLIGAKTERARQAALHTLEGSLSRRVEVIRERLLNMLAHLEAQIDFPEEDIDPKNRSQLRLDAIEICEELETILATAQEGKILRHGLSLAIVGRPNVGKSSLMNTLLGEERSIVTPIPGTTRDVIEDFISLRGLPVRVIDTAGIRRPRGIVENIGVTKSRKVLQNSDLVIHVLDATKRWSDSDKAILGICPPARTILAINKVDLRKCTVEQIKELGFDPVMISCKTGEGIELLKERIVSLVDESLHANDGESWLINERHVDAVKRCLADVKVGISQLQKNESIEIMAQSLRAALDAIGEIVGKTTTDDLLNRIFSTFCIGK